MQVTLSIGNVFYAPRKTGREFLYARFVNSISCIGLAKYIRIETKEFFL